MLSYSHQVNLEDFCSNLIGAHAYTARYLDNALMYSAPRDEIVRALEKAHLYLVCTYSSPSSICLILCVFVQDAHCDTLRELQVLDSRYGLALRSQIGRLVRSLPVDRCLTKWDRWALTNKEQRRNTVSPVFSLGSL